MKMTGYQVSCWELIIREMKGLAGYFSSRTVIYGGPLIDPDAARPGGNTACDAQRPDKPGQEPCYLHPVPEFQQPGDNAENL